MKFRFSDLFAVVCDFYKFPIDAYFFLFFVFARDNDTVRLQYWLSIVAIDISNAVNIMNNNYKKHMKFCLNLF